MPDAGNACTAHRAADANDPLAVRLHLVHRERRAHLRSGPRCGLDQDAVQNRPPRPVGHGAAVQRRR
jgi:hypothetical protein